MSDFEARLAALVEDGTYLSRGVALRALIAAGDPEAVAYEAGRRKAISDAGLKAGSEWAKKLEAGLAGASPAIPSLANRPVAYAGQAVGVGVQGLMETFQVAPKRTIGDWLDEYGYGIGLATFCAAGVTLIAAPALWPLATVLVAAAFILCWWFG